MKINWTAVLGGLAVVGGVGGVLYALTKDKVSDEDAYDDTDADEYDED